MAFIPIHISLYGIYVYIYMVYKEWKYILYGVVVGGDEMLIHPANTATNKLMSEMSPRRQKIENKPETEGS